MISGDALCDFDLTERSRSHRSAMRSPPSRCSRSRTRSSSASSSSTRTAASSASSRSRRGARCSPTRSTPGCTCSSPRCCRSIPAGEPTTSPSSCFRRCSRGKADVRTHRRRLLAGHRQPRSVPAGQLRRTRGQVQLSLSGIRLRSQRALGRGRAAPRARPDRGPRLSRQLRQDRGRRPDGAARASGQQRRGQGGRGHHPQRARLGRLCGPQRPHRGLDPGAAGGCARPCGDHEGLRSGTSARSARRRCSAPA